MNRQPLLGLKVAVIHETVPWPVSHGSDARIASLIAYLRSQGACVSLLVARSQRPEVVRDTQSRVDALEVFRARGVLGMLRDVKRRADWRLEAWALPTLDSILLRLLGRQGAKAVQDYWMRCPAGMGEFVGRLDELHRFDTIIVEYIWMHGAVAALRRQVPVVLDMHDLMHKRVEQFRKSGMRFPLKITPEVELEIIDRFSAVMAIQETEAAAISGMLRHCKVLRVGKDALAPLPLPPEGRRVGVLYVGGNNECNVDGLTWFLRDIWPEVCLRCHSAELTVVGAVHRGVSAALFRETPRTHVVGVVEETNQYYEAASICVNPVRFGSGLKIKTVEALGRARPLVTTCLGVEGMRPSPAQHCVVVDDSEAWVQALSDLILDRRRREALSASALAYAETWLTSDQTYSELTQWLVGLAR